MNCAMAPSEKAKVTKDVPKAEALAISKWEKGNELYDLWHTGTGGEKLKKKWQAMSTAVSKRMQAALAEQLASVKVESK